MDINWMGHSCFRIREKGITVVTDPYSDELGYVRSRIRADIVTVSHAHEGHNSVKGFRGSPRVLDSAGEYEIGSGPGEVEGGCSSNAVCGSGYYDGFSVELPTA